MQLQVRKIEAIDAPVLASLARQTFFDTFTGTCTEQDMQEFLVEYFNAVSYTHLTLPTILRV